MTVVGCSDDQSHSQQKSLYWITSLGSDSENEEADKFVPIETDGERKTDIELEKRKEEITYNKRRVN